jgi:multicomponent Na+:H+ antiporter subunit C
MDWINGVTIAVILFGVGVLGLILRRDLVIKLLSLGLVNSSSVLFLISLNAKDEAVAPIMYGPKANYVDPLPQALVISAIVINFALLALALVFTMLLVERYHTTDSVRIARQVEEEEKV